MKLVLDASVAVTMMASQAVEAVELRRKADELLGGDDAYILQTLTPLEVVGALRKLESIGSIQPDWAEAAQKRIFGWPFVREPITQSQIERVWELRQNFTPFEAAYLALTEALQSRDRSGRAALLTADEQLARSSKLPVEVILFPL